MPIPVITDDITPEAFEPTIKFKSVKVPGARSKKQPAKELHITELLRREGRADDTQSGGFTVGKLAVAASGGVILCGSVAFAASSWLSSPDERPLAEVRFDERAQARGASAGTEGVVKLPSNKTQQSDATDTATADRRRRPPRSGSPRTPSSNSVRRSRPSSRRSQPTRSRRPRARRPPRRRPHPPRRARRRRARPLRRRARRRTPPSSSTPPPSSNPLPTPSNPVDVSIDLGLLDPVLNTVGSFDFFAPVN